mmetsp:Transcript_25347/g.39154  ORF Transcript_25347/g.39154 Transcript_25347/m.39154 type:complete len:96 (+) Transcript_25347:1387-1674(+)|eukprot:CAMPEP_0170490518 /NCGR_PEP_ID=MMETSP0208-20121228/8683_1 /TAXON_ID=197538 /ORGANISM="Strombidium inclinatum, Strain S3" /LENGTH=95 /DNA_ID=CAMNT_0010765911 /DNA_START=1371 /DNA_END=1658 /DNA_ORIENTATION=-
MNPLEIKNKKIKQKFLKKENFSSSRISKTGICKSPSIRSPRKSSPIKIPQLGKKLIYMGNQEQAAVSNSLGFQVASSSYNEQNLARNNFLRHVLN